jgi:hypothetical protein
MPLNGFLVHLEALHRITPVAQFAKHPILYDMLIAAQGPVPNEILRIANLLVESLIDRGDNQISKIPVQRHG